MAPPLSIRRMPSRAVVLAAGLGTRMRPFSADLPKPLMPLWNRPLLARTLETLRSWGVRRALVNLHHGAAEMFRFLRENPVPGLSVDLSFEPVVLGTGGALRRAAWFPGDAPFWMVNSDIAFETDPEPLVRALARPRTIAALWMHASLGPRTVEIEDGQVRAFRSDRPGTGGTFTFCGLQALRPEILRFLPADERPFSIVEAYERAMRAGYRVAGACLEPSYWADLGTRERLLSAHAETAAAAAAGEPGGGLAREAGRIADRLRRAGVFVSGWAAVDPLARIERGARIEDSAVWAGARLGPGARVRRALIGRGAEISGAVTGAAIPFSLVASQAEAAAARAAGIRPERATAGGFDARGSAREFIRVSDGRRRAMLIRYGTERAENERYAGHTRFLEKRGIPVPRLLCDAPGERFLLMEDLGDRTLLAEWAGRADAVRARLLKESALRVDRFHAAAGAVRRARLETERPMDASLFAWEHELFLDRYVTILAGRAEAVKDLRRDLAQIAARLSDEPVVLIHRDLQSSNILRTARGPVFIDYQGMRPGPAVYDWASFLYDPYLEMSPAFRRRMIREIAAPRGLSERRLATAAIQRLTQALGAYARLLTRPGGEAFADAIPVALANLEEAIRIAETPVPALEAFVRSERSRRSGITPRQGRRDERERSRQAALSVPGPLRRKRSAGNP